MLNITAEELEDILLGEASQSHTIRVPVNPFSKKLTLVDLTTPAEVAKKKKSF